VKKPGQVKKLRRLKRKAERIPAKLQNILATKAAGSKGRRAWRKYGMSLGKMGPASEVRHIDHQEEA